MKFAGALAALLLLAPATLASAGERVIPEAQYGEALVVPATSPVSFKSFTQPLDASFAGKFVLTGDFTYGCGLDCKGPVNLELYFIPVPALATRFPHWTHVHNDIRVEISGAEIFLNNTLTAKQRAELASGKTPLVTGHAAILVDDFHTSIDCNTVYFTARFVAIARPAKVEPFRVAGDFGCG